MVLKQTQPPTLADTRMLGKLAFFTVWVRVQDGCSLARCAEKKPTNTAWRGESLRKSQELLKGREKIRHQRQVCQRRSKAGGHGRIRECIQGIRKPETAAYTPLSHVACSHTTGVPGQWGRWGVGEDKKQRKTIKPH